MLKKIRLIDFKSFVDEGVELAPLTLLVGANASGKSNFLDAIRFFQGATLDLAPGEVLDGEKRSGPDAWPGIRGRAEEAARIGTDSFTVEVWFDVYSTITIRHSMAYRTLPIPKLEETLLKALEDGSSVPVSEDDYVEYRLHLKATLHQELTYLSIKPSGMRGYGRRGYPLGTGGQNVSGVLADLSKNPENKKALVAWLAEICAPEIIDLDFLEVKELGDVMAMFVEKGGKRISARSISDGTLHFLGTLLALRTAEPGSILLIEEIETGLHPTRIRLLVEYLEAVTRERQIQVIATTHSPVVLQWLSGESLRNTIVFGRVPDREGTIMRRIGDLPHFEEVIQRKGIDELFSTGWLEMAL